MGIETHKVYGLFVWRRKSQHTQLLCNTLLDMGQQVTSAAQNKCVCISLCTQLFLSVNKFVIQIALKLCQYKMWYRLCYHLNLIIAVQCVLIFRLSIHYKLSMICENTLETPLLVFFAILLLEWVDAYTRINYILQNDAILCGK